AEWSLLVVESLLPSYTTSPSSLRWTFTGAVPACTISSPTQNSSEPWPPPGGGLLELPGSSCAPVAEVKRLVANPRSFASCANRSADDGTCTSVLKPEPWLGSAVAPIAASLSWAAAIAPATSCGSIDSSGDCWAVPLDES